MRRLALLLMTLTALLAAPAAASAQIDPDDIPMPPSGPIDPDDIPTPKPQRSAEFKVSLYGVQRFHQRGREVADSSPGCWDTRGTTDSRSVVRFSTRGPVRATVSRFGGGVTGIIWHTRRDVPLRVRATFTHDGSISGEVLNCLVDGVEGEWKPIPPPDERNCSATLDHLGFDLSLHGGRLEAVPDEGAGGPATSPFEGCPWGDRSGDLYGAEGRLRLRELLREDTTQVVLRHRERQPYADAKVKSVTTRRSTVYVVFKRVR